MVTIAHAAALTSEDALPFAHCVMLAKSSGAKLCSIHAGDDPTERDLIPDANALLAKWGADGTIEHERIVHSCCDDPVDTTLDALSQLQPDLVVTGTHQREGVIRFLIDSRAEAIAQNIDAPTLVVPNNARGFVRDGSLHLKRVVVPVGDVDAAKKGCAAARWFLELAGATSGELVLLHVGTLPPDAEPADLPEGWTCTHMSVDGKIEQAIADAAETADLIIMATRGRDSIGDALVGSHTERVFHRAPCPVLSVRMS